MFDIAPSHLVVLAIVGILVLGPERLPGLARDAGRMLRTLRELATGARAQLDDQLGPELSRELAALDPGRLKALVQDAIFDEEGERQHGS